MHGAAEARFPFDFIRIDGEFVRGLVTNPMNQLVVAAIVSIARGLGMKTVAEFVANDEATRLLRTLGVDHAQGYHIPHAKAGLRDPAGHGIGA